MATKKRVGRPTKYNDAVLTKTDKYIKSCGNKWTEFHKTRGEKSDTYERVLEVELPTLEGLALYLDVHTDTIQEWSNVHSEFSVSLAKLLNLQKKMLQQGSIAGYYNPTIAKMMLNVNHGMVEQQRTDVTTKGEKLTVVFDDSFTRQTESDS